MPTPQQPPTPAQARPSASRVIVPALAVLVALALGACTAPPPPPPPAGEALDLPAANAEDGRLLVFVQPGASELARRFERDELPALQALADEMDVALTVVDARAGAPAEVTLTPQLVYQNHRGRSVYEGRYATLDRVRNFLRTARRAPLGEATQPAEQVLVWSRGRARLHAPLKIGDVTGSPPAGYEREAFVAETRAAFVSGLERFEETAAVQLGRGDRAFYMDVYPYRGDDGTLYVSTALYSQFHCKEPVYRTPPDRPFAGPWRNRAKLFAAAAADLEAQVASQLARSEIGDGFDPLPADLAVVSWETLGLTLPEAPPGAPRTVGRGELPRRWHFAVADTDEPALLFHFPAPMDSYRGEVLEVSGSLDLTGDLPRGEVLAAATSVTMGDPDLDRWIHGAAVLKAEDHPRPTFVLEDLDLGARPLAWGELALGTGRGHLALAGHRLPVGVRAQLEPVLGDDDRPRLLATGTFSLSLGEPLAIDVPVGNPPENEQLVFDFAFELEEAEVEASG